MGSKWVKHGVSWRYYSRLGSFTLVKWDELISTGGPEGVKKSKNCWSIVNLKVKKKRQGFGTALVKAAVRKAAKHKIEYLAVIPADTLEAREFWKTFKIYVSGGYIYCC